MVSGSKLIEVVSHFPHDFRSLYEWLVHHRSEDFVPSIRWSDRSLRLCWISILEWLAYIERARSPIHVRHLSFWYPFLEPHETTYHSNTSVSIETCNQIGHVYLAASILGERMGMHNQHQQMVSKNLVVGLSFVKKIKIDIWWVCHGGRIFEYIWVIIWVDTILNHVDDFA